MEMSKFKKGDKYVHWDDDDMSVWEVLNNDRFGWSIGWRWDSRLKKSFWDMVHPSKLRHATKKEVKLNSRVLWK